MDEDITRLVEELREGKIDSEQFKSQVDEVADAAEKTARESTEVDAAEREHIGSLARKASRL